MVYDVWWRVYEYDDDDGGLWVMMIMMYGWSVYDVHVVGMYG